jgi:hypothetical protein
MKSHDPVLRAGSAAAQPDEAPQPRKLWISA